MSLVAPEVDINIGSFHPGFLDTPDVEVLPLGGTPDARNSLFVRVQKPEDGGPRANLRKRFGTLLKNLSAMSSGRSVDGLIAWPREVGTEELIAVCNGTAYRWDHVSAFVALTGGAFTPGAVVTHLPFKNQLFLMDGHVTYRYDGTNLKAPGLTAPATAPGLAAGPVSGVTGTYEGYVVWYDSVMDHESSPSETATAVVFADTQRRWTIPTGTPPSTADYWRIYARRTDTSENSFFRAGTIPIGQTQYDEAIVDAARRDRGPTDNENDVPPAFAFAEEFKGYRLGFRRDSSDMYVSKALDPESQHPRDVFPIGGKGDTKPVRSCRKYGDGECLVRKPTRTYRLVGDRVPFKILQIKGSLGGVSQYSGTEVEDWWYDWDEIKGPYRTNTITWEPLADHRITRILATLNRQALAAVQCEHHKTLNLIIWKIPVGGTTRCRMLLKYHTGLQRWLDPDTGFEYTALSQFTTQSGDYGVYFGDEWGRVYELYRGEIDGVPSGTHTATVTGATSSTVTAAAAAFVTTGNGLAGMPALVLSPAGAEQWVRVASNTATVLTLDVANGPQLGPVPSGAGWTVIVGAIDWYWWTSVLTGGESMRGKSAGWFWISAGLTAAAHVLKVACRLNRASTILATYDLTFETDGLVWGVGEWGDTWGEGGPTHERKRRMPQSFMLAQFRLSNFYPDQPVEVSRFRLTADWLRRRVPRSASA